MSNANLENWLSLPTETKAAVFEETAAQKGLPAAATEKDWWVVRTLELVFKTSIAQHTVFKGGTSLSKAWQLIDRFSEDIDLALDRTFLGISQPIEMMSGSQVSKLRKLSAEFIQEAFYPELNKLFKKTGLEANLHLSPVKSADQDPLIIEVHYSSVTNPHPYLPNRVLVEIGSRSLMEPQEIRTFSSMVGETFAGRPFADLPIEIPTVHPQRTFLEKIFLLHEEFQQSPDKVKTERKSRHWYDLYKLSNSPYFEQALDNQELYRSIVLHRKKLNTIRGIDYALHEPMHICILPPIDLQEQWKNDYQAMAESMIYQNAPRYDILKQSMEALNNRINQLNFSI